MLNTTLKQIIGFFGGGNRRHHRAAAPELTLTIEGKAYATTDWSMSGFRIANFKRPVTANEYVEGKIGPIGPSNGGSFKASIVRVTEDGGFGACWSKIDRDVYHGMSGSGP